MPGSTTRRIAAAFRMDDDAWRRHANPWSVHTRFAAIPAAALAVWSRAWLGWWSLLPVAAVVAWLWLNTRLFAPAPDPGNWATRGIYGERLWLESRDRVPREYRVVLRRLIFVGLAGLALTAWGLVRLDPWPTVFGIVLVTLAQSWRIDRMGLLYGILRERESEGR